MIINRYLNGILKNVKVKIKNKLYLKNLLRFLQIIKLDFKVKVRLLVLDWSLRTQ